MTVTRNLKGTESMTDDGDRQRRRSGPSAASIDAEENARRITRADLHENIAQAKAAESQWNSLRDSITALKNKIGDLGYETTIACQSLEAEKTDIENAQVARAANGKADDPALEVRRRKLTDQVRQLNAQEEERLAPYKKELTQLEADCLGAKKGTGYCHFEVQLIHTGRVDLIAGMHVARTIHDRAIEQLAGIRRKREAAEDDARMREFWDSQIAAAELQLSEKKVAAESALQAVIDE